jgi:hypothetical protein
MDAYEFSFVAVPAQRDAGVIKAMGGKRSLKDLADEFGAQSEYRALFKEAQLGRQYRKELENSVVRLCLTLDLGAAEPVLRGVVSKAAAEDLMALRIALQGRVDELFPMQTQLGSSLNDKREVDNGFLV